MALMLTGCAVNNHAMTDISDQIETDAAKSQATANDGVSMTRRSLTELIAADKYKRALAVQESTTSGLGFKINQIVPPGAS